jgi:hypothetical protein
MLRATTHFDQVPLAEVMKIVEAELQRQASAKALPLAPNGNSKENPSAIIPRNQSEGRS